MNELQIVIKKSGIDEADGLIMLDNFQHYLVVADDWKKQAETIVVTDGSQKEMIRKAREGRLILKDKRIEVEKRRKAMKEESLRKGQAIDAVARFLKELIEPIEEYLDAQEHFIEIKEKQEANDREVARIVKEENDRLDAAREQKRMEAEEQERLRIENERLKAQAAEWAAAIFKKDEEIKEVKVAAKKEITDLKLRVVDTEMSVMKISDGVECPACHHKFLLV